MHAGLALAKLAGVTTTRRQLLAVAAAAPLITAASVVSPNADPLVLNDSSNLNPLRVARRLRVESRDEAMITEMRGALRAAREEGRAFCVGGARHSQGGQSLPPPGGVAVDVAATAVEIDSAAGVYRVSGGARWRDVLAGLDPVGLSPAVMQSSHDFAVGAAISVNAHGWPAPKGPVGSTVRALRLMLADGSVLRCSPDENAELFRQVIGGYGLFGIVLDADLEAVPNQQLKPKFERMASAEFGARFVAQAQARETRMIYGRLDMRRSRFLQEALLCTYSPDPAAAPAPLKAPGAQSSARLIFRAQTGSEAGRSVRWFSEANLLPEISGPASRNALLNTPVAVLGPPSRGATDILHEYFLPPQALEAFLVQCRRLVLASGAELLNITLRYVAADASSVMGYAPDERIAAVMFFSQPLTARGEEVMRALTVGLVQAALDLGGSFYLPYRLHALPEQLRAAYKAVDAFAAAKRAADPDLVFRNLMWDHYFSRP